MSGCVPRAAVFIGDGVWLFLTRETHAQASIFRHVLAGRGFHTVLIYLRLSAHLSHFSESITV